ncbi:MAG: TolC family protein [Elusimicrobiales bacterium]|nr:TolC family protein [Elusimicrobiales bacterium]
MKKAKITREIITQKAIELFAQNGIDNVSMNEIAKELGVTKPVIYYYFKNKDEMIKYAFSMRVNEMDGIYKDIQNSGDVKEFIKNLIDKHIYFFSKNSSNIKCFFKIIDSDKRKYMIKMANDLVDKNRKYVYDKIEEMKKRDEKISKTDTMVISDFVFSMISYLIMEKKMDRKIDVKRIYKVVDIFLKGLSIFLFLFVSPSLSNSLEVTADNIVDMAFEKNISLQNAYTLESVYKEKINEYYGSAYPQISLSASYTKNIEKPLAFFGGRKTEVGMENSYSLALNLNQVLWAGGKVDTAIKMAEIYADISKENTRLSQNFVKRSVKQIFYSVLYAKELVKIQNDILNISREHLKTTEEKFKQGLSSDLNVLRQKVEVSNNEPALIKADNLYKTGLLNLKNLLGLELDDSINVSGKFDYKFSDYDFNELYRSALVNRPDYKLAILNKKMSEKQLKLEKAGHWPTLSLFASRQFSGQSETSRFPSENSRGWSMAAGISFSMPVFNGFSTVSKIKQAEYNLEISERNIEDLRRKIKIELMQALFNIEESKKRIESQRVGVENAAKVLKSTEERFNNGLSSQLELNDATLVYNTARLSYISAVYDYITAVVNLDYVVGI